MLNNIDTSREFISNPEAARRSGLTRIYLAQLLRKGTLEGFHLGREWFVYTDSLEKFLTTPRKPGPKGPHKTPKGLPTLSSEHLSNALSATSESDQPDEEG